MKSRKEKQDTNILLIDCSNLIYAAYYTMGTLSWEGKSTGIIYGFLKKVLFLAEKFNTNRFITCWDGGTTYRHKDYPGYKKGRIKKKEKESSLEKEDRGQILEQSLKLRLEVLPAMGFKNNYFQKYYEADDLLAWWVKKMYKKGENHLIMVTSDNDMYQCLALCKIYSVARKKMFTEKHLMKKYGVPPEQWPFAKAIGGCSGDSVIGIQGASDPKNESSKALKYLHGKLTKGIIFDRICSREGKQIINDNLPIVTCPYRPEDLGTMIRRRDKFSRKKFIRVFDSFHFKSFLKQESFQHWKQAFLR